MTSAEKWETVLKHKDLIKAIINREMPSFRNRHDEDLISEGMIAYFKAIDKVTTVHTLWNAIKYHLWYYIDKYITGHTNRGRKEKVKVTNISTFDETVTAENKTSNYILDSVLVSKESSLFNQVYHAELIRKIREQLGSFDNKILSLMYLEYSQVEIAKELNVPVYIIYNHLKVIRQTAKNIVKEQNGI